MKGSSGKDGGGGGGGGGAEGHRRNRSAERSNSLGTGDKRKPKLPIAEQLSELWLTDETTPEKIILVNISEKQGQFIAQCLQGTRLSLVTTISAADVEASIQFIVHKIQKYCNQNAKVLSPIKIGICGSDSYIGSVLKPYVEQFSAKSSEWLNYVKFYIVPTGNNSVAKYLSSLDTRYNSLFQDSLWKEVWDKAEKEASDKREVANRVEKYLSGATTSLGLPIGEVMLTCKQRGSDNESCQKFVPFINNVLIGPPNSALGAVAIAEGEESLSAGSLLSSSPPSTAVKERVEGGTPPPSPAVSTTTVPQSSSSSSVTPTSPPVPPGLGGAVGSGSSTTPILITPGASGGGELLDLQVEYWPMSGSKKDKSSLKTAFRSLTVYRLPACSEAPAASSALSMLVVTKEKNKKTVMRIGKKTGVPELKSQTVDGIYRLVCTSRTQDYSLTVTIDGNELSRVKFFQLSAQWQTHVKQFPVALFGHVEAPC